ncbi:MAG: beta-lactamase class [Frankiaceae bacterium]|nr:beta-lactamase class [Frankiaceae bacterium]
MAPAAEGAIRELFEAVGVDGHLHAVDLATGAEVAYRADDVVVAASVFKLPVLVELCRQVSAGEVDAAEQVTVPAEGRSPGPFGISIMRDPVTMSWRDLAWLMTGISDNAAADVVTGRVGIDRVNATLASLGLTATRVEEDCAGIVAGIVADAGSDLVLALSDPARLARLRALDPALTNRTTAKESTTLLRLVWTDRAAPPAACAEVRRILGLQVWPHRLASGFPEDGVRTSGKTGSLGPVRNEAGVVEYAGGGSYAVAVFTRSRSTALKHPAADAAIGTAARLAVDALRAATHQ